MKKGLQNFCLIIFSKVDLDIIFITTMSLSLDVIVTEKIFQFLPSFDYVLPYS